MFSFSTGESLPKSVSWSQFLSYCERTYKSEQLYQANRTHNSLTIKPMPKTFFQDWQFTVKNSQQYFQHTVKNKIK